MTTDVVMRDDVMELVDALDKARQRLSAMSTAALAYGTPLRAECMDGEADAMDVLSEDLLAQADAVRAVSEVLRGKG